LGLVVPVPGASASPTHSPSSSSSPSSLRPLPSSYLLFSGEQDLDFTAQIYICFSVAFTCTSLALVVTLGFKE